MAEILKSGHIVIKAVRRYETKCGECRCVFAFTEKDMCYMDTLVPYRHTHCPECKAHIWAFWARTIGDLRGWWSDKWRHLRARKAARQSSRM